jgi:CheY-like chemotaxis protein
MTDAGATIAQKCDPGKILIVDDEESIRNLFRMILSFDLPGKRIDLAANGLEAVDAFRAGRHAVLLMDLRMPKMDGYQAFCAIRQLCTQENWCMPSVVFCTGFNPSDEVRDLTSDDNSAHRLLHKPVNSRDITAAIRGRLDLLS